MPSAGLETGEWGKRFWLISSWSSKKTQLENKKINASVVSDPSERKRGVERVFSNEMIHGDRLDASAASSSASQTQLRSFVILWWVPGKQMCWNACIINVRDTHYRLQTGCIQGEVGRHRWGLLMWFLLCSRTLVYFVKLICLFSIDPWPSSDALRGRLMCVCVWKSYRRYKILEWFLKSIIIKVKQRSEREEIAGRFSFSTHQEHGIFDPYKIAD